MIAEIDPQNPSSWKVVEKLGLLFMSMVSHQGKPALSYSIMRTEFLAGDQ